MINGPTSRIIYLGAWVCVLACIVGIVVLAYGEHGVPAQLDMALAGSLGVVGGSHIMPPLSQKATRSVLDKEAKDE